MIVISYMISHAYGIIHVGYDVPFDFCFTDGALAGSNAPLPSAKSTRHILHIYIQNILSKYTQVTVKCNFRISVMADLRRMGALISS